MIKKHAKKLIVFIFLIKNLIPVFSQDFTIKPQTDERVELLGIVFRLAGAKEYNNNYVQPYASQVDNYFKPFGKHAVIKMVKKIRLTNGVAYDAVMSMAIHIEINQGKIKFIDNISETSLAERWGTKSEKFIQLLNDFYQDSNFHQFYMDHMDLYNATAESFNKHLQKVDFNWFKEFYGELPQGSYNLIVSLTNWGNYGPRLQLNDGRKDIYAIMGAWKVDSLGVPVYNDQVINTIIHEFNHSFCNPLINLYYDQVKEKNEAFYELSKEKLRKQAYGRAQTMMYEILVRASVIKYYQSHLQDDYIDEQVIKETIAREKAKGFIWISELVNLLDEYENGDYNTLREFMPQIVSMVNSLDANKIYHDYTNACPRIISTSIHDGDKQVDPNITELVINFDKPMNTKKNGSSTGKKGNEYLPDIINSKWNEENKTQWIISLKLKPNSSYSILFPAIYFIDENSDFFLAESYYLDFKTRRK